MATRAAREKLQSQNDRHKEILAKMLAKEENKFCADCLSKGPRWVSWNLGIFVCIRCSGIHRSLGVHISKVKSVNLDTWTPDQMTSVCKRGNGWAKETFEARLPKDYPRPQNDSSMEYFIRDKYENKKYISSTPIPLRSLEGLYEEEKGEPAKRISSNRNTNVSLPAAAKNAAPAAAKLSPVPRRQTTTTQLPKQQTTTSAATVVDDLLGLESPVKQPSSSATPASTTTPTPPSADLTFDLFQSAPSVNPPPSSAFQTKADTSTTGGKTIMSKDSILSLYSQNPTPRQQTTTTNNQQFPTTNQFGGMTQIHQASGFPPTNTYNFQQQGGANTTTTAGMMYNQQQQQQQFPQQQFQWQQQQQQQQPLHMQMGNMNMNGRGFPQQQQQQQANMYPQQYHPQQQQQGFTPQQQMFNNGGFGGQQPQQFRPQGGASGWQQNGQTLSNHLWK